MSQRSKLYRNGLLPKCFYCMIWQHFVFRDSLTGSLLEKQVLLPKHPLKSVLKNKFVTSVLGKYILVLFISQTN